MKFAEHLGAHITPEWRKQYIQYEVIKDMIYQSKEMAPSAEVTDESVIQRYFARFDETFFQFCDKELAKINTFFYEKISEATRKYASLKTDMQLYSEHEQKPSTIQLRRRRSSVTFFKEKENKEINRTRKLHDLKLAFSEFYLSLILLQNYQTLNFTGFRKILKKHDKMMQTTRGVIWRQAHVDTAAFYTNKEVDHLISEVEQNFTSNLEGGNRQKAMKRLRVPPLGDEENPMTTFRVGFFSGIFSILIIVVVITAFYAPQKGPWEPALRMYRGMFIVVLDIFLLGINTYGWRSSGVNHVLIFEIDPRRHLTHQQLMELSGTLAVIWCFSVLLYLFSGYLGISGYVFPLALAGFMLLFCIFQLSATLAVIWCFSVLLYLFSGYLGISGYVFPLALAGFMLLFCIFQLSATLAVIWCFSVLLYLFSGYLGISGYVFPLALAGFMLLFCIFQLSATLAVIWCFSVLLYLFSGYLGISGYVFPLALAGFMLLFCIFQLSATLAVIWCFSVLLYLFSGYLGISGYVFPLALAGFMLLFCIFQLSATLAVIWCFSVLLYLFSGYLGISGYVFPLALAGFMLLFLINPIRVLHHSSRMWLLKILFQIFTAPFHHVGFADFWLADQLNSLVTVLLDFEYMACFYAFEVDWLPTTNPGVCTKQIYGIRTIIGILPAWWRFAQCLRRYRDSKLVFPHIVNAGKYSTSFFTAFFSTMYHIQKELYGEDNRQNHAFFYLWIVCAVISSCYTLTWDLKMDWGLLDSSAGENRFLREEIVYAYKFYYYFAIVEDFILRFIWSLSVSIGEGLLVHNEILKTLLASLEIFRRFVWNFFRLENEHLNNCGQFRAVRDISIAPIDSSDLSQLIDLMDDEHDRAFSRRKEIRPLLKSKSEKILEENQIEKVHWKFKGV